MSQPRAVIWAHSNWYVTDLKKCQWHLRGSTEKRAGWWTVTCSHLDREGPQLKISVQDTDMTVVSGTAV